MDSGGSPLFKGRLSKCLMHDDEDRHLFSHKALSVPVHLLVLSAGQSTLVLSVRPWCCGAAHDFPRTFFFKSSNSQPPHKISFILFLISVNARVPCFPLGCPVGCVNAPCQLCNIAS